MLYTKFETSVIFIIQITNIFVKVHYLHVYLTENNNSNLGSIPLVPCLILFTLLKTK